MSVSPRCPYTSKLVVGDVPTCIWDSFPDLTSIQLSYNGLGGTFPENAFQNSKNLITLDISGNHLWGSVPGALLQQLKYGQIDLSNNKFTGDISNFSSSFYGNLTLNVNRISGSVPSQTFQDTDELDILVGNTFSCADLPRNDMNFDSFFCGSKTLNEASYTFFGVVGFSIISALTMSFFYNYPSSARLMLSRLISLQAPIDFTCCTTADNVESLLPRFSVLYRQMRNLQWRMFSLTLITLTLMICIFVGLKTNDYYSPVMYQYGWSVSVVFLSGTVPAIFLMLLWFTLETYLVFSVRSIHLSLNQYQIIEKTTIREALIDTTDKKSPSNLFSYKFLLDLLYSIGAVVFIVAVVGAGNYVFVISVASNENVSLSTIFIALLNFFCSVYLIPASILFLSTHTQWGPKFLGDLFLFLRLIQGVFGPLITNMFTQDACFFEVIIPQKPTTYYYTTSECSNINTIVEECDGYYDVQSPTSTFLTPFIYNNQCLTAVLKNYTWLKIYIFIVQGFVVPVLYYLLSRCNPWKIPHWIRFVMPRVLWPKSHPGLFTKVISPRSYLTDALINALVMMTFGCGSLVLVAAAGISIIINLALWRAIMREYVREIVKDSNENRERCVLELEEACKEACRIPYDCIWILTGTGTLFFMFATFDIGADREDLVTAFIVPIITFSYFIVLLVVVKLVDRSSKLSVDLQSVSNPLLNTLDIKDDVRPDDV